MIFLRDRINYKHTNESRITWLWESIAGSTFTEPHLKETGTKHDWGLEKQTEKVNKIQLQKLTI